MLHPIALLHHWQTILTKYTLKSPRRYREILQCAAKRNVMSILEIGVYTGARAAEMINAACIHQVPKNIQYDGFDLFEGLTPELCSKEYSKMPAPEKAIQQYLEKTGARIVLHRGFSEETLPEFVRTNPEPYDLIFIDGGHMVETIKSDWQNIEKLIGEKTVVFFDDYYRNDPKDVPGIGCQTIIDSLDRTKYDVRVCNLEDRFLKPWGTLNIRLARVTLRPHH